MMQHSNRAHLDPKNQLKLIHGDQNLRADDQYVAHGDDAVGNVGRVEICGEEGDADEGVECYEEEEEFCKAGDVVVYETAAVGFGEVGGVVDAIDAGEEVGGEDELFC